MRHNTKKSPKFMLFPGDFSWDWRQYNHCESTFSGRNNSQ